MTVAVAPRAAASEPLARPPAAPADDAAPVAEPHAAAPGRRRVGVRRRARRRLRAGAGCRHDPAGVAAGARGACRRRAAGAARRSCPAATASPRCPTLGEDGLGAVVAGAAELRAARRDHACVVVDCGRLADAGARAALALATHVVWTVPAGAEGGTTATALLLDGELAPPPGEALELLAVVATRPAAVDAGEQRALREVVAVRGERLVLIPHVRALAGARESALRTAPKRLAGAVAAIAAVLRREPPP